MHALFFEMRPKAGHLDHYFEHVARLRPVLARHDGLVFLDRYGSLGDKGLLLSHQLWENEDAITAWRKDAEHSRSQAAGRYVHFADYRIRVGERVLHWTPTSVDTPTPAEASLKRSFILALYGRKPSSDPQFAAFESFNHSGHFISLGNFDESETIQSTFQSQIEQPGLQQVAAYRILRDYGQFDRAEAP